jgi:hypothetical protein
VQRNKRHPLGRVAVICLALALGLELIVLVSGVSPMLVPLIFALTFAALVILTALDAIWSAGNR